MLLISQTIDEFENGNSVPHVLRRFSERVCGRGRVETVIASDAKKILSLIAEINHYLPEDWRMTRTKNNFRIFVQYNTVELVSEFVLAGETFRYPNSRVLHIVRTVYRPHWLDKVDREQFLAERNITPTQWNEWPVEARDAMNESLANEHPGLVSPNLYFFKPPVDDCPSPLFARQFEKRLLDTDGWEHEYHRIHPLTRRGMDHAHHRWIQWHRDGTMGFIRQPEADYRGVSYWSLPRHSQGEEAALTTQWTHLLDHYHVSSTSPEPATSTYETEFKLLWLGDPRLRNQLFDATRHELVEFGLDIESEYPIEQTDTYFDDCQFTLWLAGSSLRLRRTNEVHRVTLKSRRPSGTGDPYVRHEVEVVISSQDAHRFLGGEDIAAEPCASGRTMYPTLGRVIPRVKVLTTRQVIVVKDAAGRQAEVCLDFSRFLNLAGDEIGRDVEIELESKGLPRADLENLAQHLEHTLAGVQPSNQSKYQRSAIYNPGIFDA
jgi:uncharacterized protein YjbK